MNCSCDDDDPPAPAPPVTITSVDATAQISEFASASDVAKGSVVQFVATANRSDGTKSNVTSTSTWVSSDPAILAFETASVPGVATAKKQGGPITVTATEAGGKVATLTYSVVAPAPVSLAISPAQVPNGVPVGLQDRFTASYILTDKTTADATMDVDWSSSDGAIVAVGNETGNKGIALAVAAGTSNISASKGTLRSQDVEVSVFAPTEPPQFVVEPASPDQLPLGRTQQFKALLKYSTDQVFDITDSVTWQTNAENIASFPAALPAGLLLANAATTGQVMVTALDPSTANQTTPVTIDVTNPTIVSVVITPAATADKPLPVHARRQLGVIATFSDNIPRDITQTVDWKTGGLGNLSVTDTFGSKGLVTAVQVTESGAQKDTVIATDPVSSQSVSLVIETTGRLVEKVRISPITAQEVPQGQSVQFEATAVYNDSTEETVTKLVTWESIAADKVTISNSLQDKGRATAVKRGTTVINAAYVINGEKILSENFVTVVVTAAELVSIAIKPASAITLAVGQSQRLTVDGTFSDASVRDVSGVVNWKSLDSNTVRVGTSGRERGVITGVAVGGSVNVVATEPRTNITAVKQISVTEKTFDSILITPASANRPAGIPYKDFVATAIYSDGPGDIITEQVQWVSSNDAIAVVSNEKGSRGDVFPKSFGTVTITASAKGIVSAPVKFNVADAVLLSIALSPGPSTPPNVNIGDIVQFTAKGSYSDSKDRDITVPAYFESNNVRAAFITNNVPNSGKLVALGAGTAEITAHLDNIFSPATMVVVAAPPQESITTVAQIRAGCCTAGQQITMQGQITTWDGAEDYTFVDSTGSIEVKWQGQPPITLNIDILVIGVANGTNEVDASNWSPL